MKYCRIENDQVVEVHNLSDKGRLILIGLNKQNNPRQYHYDQTDNWLLYVDPVVGENQYLGDYIISVDTVTHEVIDRTAEEIDAILTANKKMMDQSCRSYIDEFAHWSAAPMIFDKAKSNLPKSKAIKEWTEAVWLEYWTREAMLDGGVPWSNSMLDFSIVGPCPYKIKEAMEE